MRRSETRDQHLKGAFIVQTDFKGNVLSAEFLEEKLQTLTTLLTKVITPLAKLINFC